MGLIKQSRDPDLSSDLTELISEIVDKPEKWLDTPNDQLGGEKPRKLIGTDREGMLRDLARAIKIGMPT